jgi:hypothetical protein
MSSSSGKVTTVVIEVEPGLVYVKVADPKPEPDRIDFYLRRTIEEWFAAHSDLVIDKSQAIIRDGELQGIHVWYHATGDGPQGTPQKHRGPANNFTVKIHDRITEQFSFEYIEAVLVSAMKIRPAYEHHRDSLVVVNPRRIAVVIDKQGNRVAISPLDLVEQTLDAPAKHQLEKWLTARPTQFFVAHIARNWFTGSW